MRVKFTFIQAVDMAEVKRAVYFSAIFKLHLKQTVFVVQNHRHDARSLARSHVAGEKINHKLPRRRNESQFIQGSHADIKRECAKQIAQTFTKTAN